MVNDNIKYFRKAKGLTQEEMALKLNVVRQTVSKWEKGLSVPDADVLIHIAEILEVSVGQLLGVEENINNSKEISEELVKVNEELAKRIRKEKLLQKANEKRGLILSFFILAVLIVSFIKNEILSMTLVGICCISAIIVLYRNLALLTSVTTDNMKIGVLKITTLFNLSVLVIGIIFSILTALNVISFSKNGEKMFAMALIFCIMVFMGIISTKLPYNKHTGLRLPWTVRDEETWNIAHKVLGIISIPVALLYSACAINMSDFESVTLCATILWIGIPSLISYIFFYKKLHL